MRGGQLAAEPSWNRLSACSLRPPRLPHKCPRPALRWEPQVSTAPWCITPPLAGLRSDSTRRVSGPRGPSVRSPSAPSPSHGPKGITLKCLGTRGGRVRPESLERLSEQPCWRRQEAEARVPWLSLPLYSDGLEGGAPPESRALGPRQPPPGLQVEDRGHPEVRWPWAL